MPIKLFPPAHDPKGPYGGGWNRLSIGSLAGVECALQPRTEAAYGMSIYNIRFKTRYVSEKRFTLLQGHLKKEPVINNLFDKSEGVKMKYKNYSELIEAFKSGELDKKKYKLIIDNDNSFLDYFGDDMDDDEAYEHCKTLFSGDGDYDMVDVCNAAGIPAERC